jgi:hypothetical protein
MNLRLATLRAFLILLIGAGAMNGKKTALSTCRDCSVLSAVVAAEMQALRLPVGGHICLSVAGKDPSDAVFRQLRKDGLDIRKGSQCTRRPHGTLIVVDKIGRGRETSEVPTETMDMNLDGSHFATQLRKGTYHLKAIEGRWVVDNYVPKTK